MDMTRYEKIDGREALKRLAGGETILDDSNHRYLLNWMNFVVRRESGAYETVNDGLKQILEKTWYIPKPFDVRQAMRDKPDEWVGVVYKSDRDCWYKVGFDTNYFVAIEAKHDYDGPFELTSIGVERALRETLNDCIPLDEVPADAR